MKKQDEKINQIEYYLRPNNLVELDQYYAYVKSSKTLGLGDIVNEIAETGSTLTETDVNAVMRIAPLIMARYLSRGYRLRLPMGTFSIAVRGVFEGAEDVFDPARHTLEVTVKPGSEWEDLLPKKPELKKTVYLDKAPKVTTFTDQANKLKNETVSSGNIGLLSGANMKFDEEDLEEGVFFVKVEKSDQGKKSGKEIRVAQYSLLTPTKINFLVPTLEKGATYRVEVRFKPRPDSSALIGSLKKNLKAQK